MSMPSNRLAAAVACVCSMAGGFLLSTTAMAQEQPQGEILELEEVTVTASRRDESLQDVAISVAVVDVNDH